MRRIRDRFGIALALGIAGLAFVACSGNDLDFQAKPESGGSGGLLAGSGGKSAGNGGSMSRGGAGGSGASTSKGGSAGMESGGDGGADDDGGSGGTDAGGEGGSEIGGGAGSGGMASGGMASGGMASGGMASGGMASGGMASGGMASGGEGGSGTTGTGGMPQVGGNVGKGGTAGSGGGCNPSDWFPDDDGDDYGRTSGKVSACEPPGQNWVHFGGDCNDDNPAVSPEQKPYTDEPYLTAGGGDSFDYDCSGAEQSDPTQFGLAPTCPLTAIDCAGTGYVPTGRSGPGINPLCGSTTIVSCVVVNALGCEAAILGLSEPHRCR